MFVWRRLMHPWSRFCKFTKRLMDYFIDIVNCWCTYCGAECVSYTLQSATYFLCFAWWIPFGTPYMTENNIKIKPTIAFKIVAYCLFVSRLYFLGTTLSMIGWFWSALFLFCLPVFVIFVFPCLCCISWHSKTLCH